MNVYRLLPRLVFRSIAPTARRSFPRNMATSIDGDLNNTAAERARAELAVDPTYRNISLAIPASEDEDTVRKSYRPFLINDANQQQEDWVAKLELSTVLKMVDLEVLRKGGDRLKVLVLHGSMRKR